jgi:hypothetical protein
MCGTWSFEQGLFKTVCRMQVMAAAQVLVLTRALGAGVV